VGEQSDVTRLLKEWSQGHEEALDLLIPTVYEELRRLARSYMRKERPGHTLQPTALVNEAFIHLVGQRVSWQNRAHFFGIAAQCMRRLLVDYARRHNADKRGHPDGGVNLELLPTNRRSSPDYLLAFHEALNELAKTDERRARILELRCFGELEIKEIAHVTGLSPATIKKELRAGRAWLRPLTTT
jgi:RNA polymerase sigma factor (TIGR02999 family)